MAGVNLGHVQIFLEAGEPSPKGVYLYFVINDADAFYEFHRNNGVEIVQPIGNTIANTRYAIMPSATCTATSCRSDIVYAGEYKMKPIYLAVASFALGAVCFASISQPDRTGGRGGDSRAHRQHLSGVHRRRRAEDLRHAFGRLARTARRHSAPIKGIDEYMRANGIDWPKAANAPKRTSYFAPGTTYKMSDFDVHFLQSGTGGREFHRRVSGKTGETLRRFRIMDIYAKRKETGSGVASHTAIDPEWRAEQMSKPLNVTPDIRKQVLAKREAVWKTFTNDRATLEKLVRKR